MVVFTIENESASTVAPAKLYKALVTDFDNLIPKAIEAIQNVEIVEGNGGPGTIKKITMLVDGETKYVLHKVEAIDEANWGYNYSVVGGVGLPESLENISIKTKLVEGPNGGSIAKISAKVQTKGDVQPNEENAKAIGKARGDAFFKAIETYISSNPDYN
ncbi:hypothetical protein Lal_00040659 [Lupinus albus]|uniref:Putative START-like domain, Bet v I type allergen n=1 Tax=Lupinus albus TaxID=3870 RepID=A0A6A4PJ46_LUPAL|nr:putative START-like domain, Bet v I type allergen [Lupinus albus]KAF1887605.1 hypothetical protein Lal_00040659 [Lupinus albus]